MIRVDVEDQGWQTLGAGAERGVYPSTPSPTWDAWGPASLTFNIARDPSKPWPDLAAGTPIEYVPYDDADAAPWGGYITDTPAAGEDGLVVNARGWQGALDDDPVTDTYVHTRMSDWKDARTAPGAYLYDGALGWTAAGQVSVADGEINLSLPQGAIVKANAAHGVYLDLGPLSRGARAVSVDMRIPAGWTVADLIYVRGSNSPADPYMGNTGDYHDGGGPWVATLGNVTRTAVFPRPFRYLCFFIYSGGAYTTGVEQALQITGIRTFTDDAYRSGAASALKASHILKRAVTRVPALSQDASLITDTAFVIPAFGGVNEERTPRQEVEQANTYHRYITRVRADRRLEFRQRFAAATLEANTRRAGVDWQDASLNSLDEVWNKVTIKGKSGGGTDLAITSYSSDVGIRNVLDRRQRTRSKTLVVDSPTDLATMQALAVVWLQRYARTPLKGTLTIAGPEALRELPSGSPVAAGYVGERCAELVLLSNLIDPDTGGHGREAVTAGASYNEVDDVATIAIDNTRDDLEGLLARMGVVSGG